MKILPVELTEAVCHYSSPKLCEKFFEDGFEINTQNIKGCTLLMFSVMPDENGDSNSALASKEMVLYLLEKGADPFIADNTNMNSIDYAKLNLDPNWKDRFGYYQSWDKNSLKVWGEIIEILEKWNGR